MPSNLEIQRAKASKQKKVVGAVAIALLVAFIFLGILRLLDTLTWVIAALVVAGIANLLFRRIGREPL
jgi:hypothetical protein